MALAFPVAALRIGVPLAKVLIKRFTGETTASVTDSLIETAGKRIENYEDQRAAGRVFEDISDKIVSRIVPIFATIESSSASSIASELGKTLETNISAEYLLANDLNPTAIAAAYRTARPLDTRFFGPDEIALYERALDEAVRYLVGAAGSLPHFDMQATATLLARISRMSTDIEAALDAVSRIERLVGQGAGSHDDEPKRFEADYRQAVAQGLDYLELFGADIALEAQRHTLSVGYVSLNLSMRGNGLPGSPLRASGLVQLLAQQKGRLLIRGDAGTGKSTLLRWFAIKAATGELRRPIRLRRRLSRLRLAEIGMMPIPLAEIQITAGVNAAAAGPTEQSRGFGRGFLQVNRVPFLIRLRDCPKGRLPTPNEFPTLIAREVGEPPKEWVRSILAQGRALVLLDGVDEVANNRREQVRRDIEAIVKQYPTNWYIVTTRPTAVAESWLAADGFTEVSVTPMNETDRTEFIGRWHRAVAAELARQGRDADISRLAEELVGKLSENPAIARLASNPLLCAVICALHRERHRKLPESQSELCEAICHLLLHRREIEGGLSIAEFPEEYRGLTYEQKRAVVQAIAHHMVRNDDSVINEDDALAEAKSILSLFPTATGYDSRTVLRMIIERSGILREQRPGSIDFVHNSLKEYLAAGIFVERNDVSLLSRRSADDSWRQVVLFASATRDRQFASRLIGKIIERASSESDPNVSRRLRLTAVDCRSSALYLEPSLVQQISYIERQLVPPRSMADAEVLATSGDRVVPLLHVKKMTARSAAACVRALRLVGTPLARRALSGYFKDRRQTVVSELCHAANPLLLDAIVAKVVSGQALQFSVAQQITDLTPLERLHALQKLDLQGSNATTLRPVGTLKRLHTLNLMQSAIRTIEGIDEAKSLEDVNLAYTKIIDIAQLQELKLLRRLNVSGCEVVDFNVLSGMTSLEDLSLARTQLADLSILAPLPQLRRLDISYCTRVDFNTIKSVLSLSHLEARNLGSADVAMIPTLPLLEEISFKNTALGNWHVLAEAQKLRALELSNTGITNLNFLSKTPSIENLSIAGCEIKDAEPLGALHALRGLDADDTSISDISILAACTKLQSLGLANTKVDDLTVLRELKDIEFLRLPRSDVLDLTPLQALPKLAIVDIPALTEAQAQTLLSLPQLIDIWTLGSQKPGVRRILGRRLTEWAES